MDNLDTISIYTCDKCNFSVISSKKVNNCFICNNKMTKKKNSSAKEEGKIIPFKITKSECVNILRKSTSPIIYKFLASDIKKSIYKVYLPTLLFNFEMSGDIILEGGVESTWKNNNYKYIKTDEYKITSSCDSNFNKLLVSCFDKIDNKLLHSIEPFDYTITKNIDNTCEYMVYYDMSINDVIGRANKEFVNTIINKLHNYKNLSVKKLKINKRVGTYEYYLVPVYLVNFNNNILLINGQTGKISNSLIISKSKIIFALIVIFIIYFILILFIIKVIK